MKWFKHVSTAMDDLFIQDLERKFGDSGYAFWFKTLELMGAHGEGGELDISWSNYQHKLHKSQAKIEQLLTFCSTNGKLSFISKSDILHISCPKFAEYADNYTKYDGLSTKRLQRQPKVSSKQEGEEEVDTEEEKKKTIFPTQERFEEVWKEYPNKDGKTDAIKHFRTTVKSEDDFTRLRKALKNYLASRRVREGFVKNGSTWFNRWQDWENFIEPLERPKPVETEAEKRARLEKIYGPTKL
jgi:hypothetical protein